MLYNSDTISYLYYKTHTYTLYVRKPHTAHFTAFAANMTQFSIFSPGIRYS